MWVTLVTLKFLKVYVAYFWHKVVARASTICTFSMHVACLFLNLGQLPKLILGTFSIFYLNFFLKCVDFKKSLWKTSEMWNGVVLNAYLNIGMTSNSVLYAFVKDWLSVHSMTISHMLIYFNFNFLWTLFIGKHINSRRALRLMDYINCILNLHFELKLNFSFLGNFFYSQETPIHVKFSKSFLGNFVMCKVAVFGKLLRKIIILN